MWCCLTTGDIRAGRKSVGVTGAKRRETANTGAHALHVKHAGRMERAAPLTHMRARPCCTVWREATPEAWRRRNIEGGARQNERRGRVNGSHQAGFASHGCGHRTGFARRLRLLRLGLLRGDGGKDETIEFKQVGLPASTQTSGPSVTKARNGGSTVSSAAVWSTVSRYFRLRA